ncbi:probable beta-ketoadipyl-CoA thiolase [Rhodococcus opacus B4]|uniref:Probable beta-ketoadipyl-CoA thiolase n=1 Tax=Rhodococcus opacus (strain B4) TaxID=632772 RepID=C1AV55_RHOOB|nr:probable beta-ketoadipyl-CoA thiolase [Rhodococcus opacus B4]
MSSVPVLVAPRRTPIGNAGHGFADLTTTDLAAPVLREVLDALRGSGLDAEVDDVVLGNCLGPGGDPARVAALRAGMGVEVPGVTVDRQCGSGLDAVMQAALRVRSGADELILAGGVESASTAPWRFWPPVAGADPVRYTRTAAGSAVHAGDARPAPVEHGGVRDADESRTGVRVDHRTRRVASGSGPRGGRRDLFRRRGGDRRSAGRGPHVAHRGRGAGVCRNVGGAGLLP